MADFTVTFVVKKENTVEWTTYKQFIESLRQRRELIFRQSHGRPVIHPEENPPARWFDVVLQTSNHRVTLRLRRGNLYLVGYQMENNQWLEFGLLNDTHHQIPGSTFLGFKGDYGSLDKNVKKDQLRENIKLGWKSMETAVSNLATSNERTDRAWALIVVIQMISESIRFRSISNQLATKFQDDSTKDNKAEKPPTWMMEQETSWADISEELLHVDSDPNHRFQPPDPKTGIKTVEQAVEAIGMIKYYRYP